MNLTGQTQSSEQEQLPDFERPPVTETVFGVQFEPLTRFNVATLGVYWNSLGKEEWPDPEEAPPIPIQFEEKDKAGQLHLAFRLSHFGPSVPQESRLRIRHKSRERMIQVQSSRFLYNWVGHGSDSSPKYIHFHPARDEFLENLEKFKQFIEVEQLGEFLPNQWELTYVNHIHKGTIWHSPADWPSVLELFGNKCNCIPNGALERFKGVWSFGINSVQPARLHINVEHKTNRQDPSKEVLEVRLTARGSINKHVSLTEGLDIGHEAIVRGFTAITSEKAHEYWGRKQ